MHFYMRADGRLRSSITFALVCILANNARMSMASPSLLSFDSRWVVNGDAKILDSTHVQLVPGRVLNEGGSVWFASDQAVLYSGFQAAFSFNISKTPTCSEDGDGALSLQSGADLIATQEWGITCSVRGL